MNYLLETYATDDVITKMNGRVLRFTQPFSLMHEKYRGAVWNKALRSDLVMMNKSLREYSLRGYMDRLDIARAHIGAWTKMLRFMTFLAGHATLLTSLQFGSFCGTLCHTTTETNNSHEDKNDRRSSWKLTAVAHVDANSMASSPTK